MTPSWLEIYWALEYHQVFMIFLVDVCRPTTNGLACEEQARLEAELAGANGTVSTHTYFMVHELVDGAAMPKGVFTPTVYDCSNCEDAAGNPLPYSEWPVEGARYDFEGHTGDIDLSSIPVGEQFVVRYYLYTEGNVPRGVKSGVTSFIGDPLDADAGISFDPGPGVTVAEPQPQVNTQSCNLAVSESTPDSRFVFAAGRHRAGYSHQSHMATVSLWLFV